MYSVVYSVVHSVVHSVVYSVVHSVVYSHKVGDQIRVEKKTCTSVQTFMHPNPHTTHTQNHTHRIGHAHVLLIGLWGLPRPQGLQLSSGLCMIHFSQGGIPQVLCTPEQKTTQVCLAYATWSMER